MKKTLILWTSGILILLLTMAGAVATDGLVVEYTFDSGLNADTSGNGLNSATTGSLNNPTGFLGNGVSGFSDANYLTTGDNNLLDFTTALSVCAIYNNTPTDAWETIAARYHTTGLQRMFNFQVTYTDRTSLTLGSPDGSATINTDGVDNTFPQGWSFVCAVWNASQTSGTAQIYVNGTEIGSYVNQQNNSYNLIGSSATTPLYIGKSPYTTGRTVVGVLDELTIWNKKLTPTEIQDLWTNYQAGYHASETPTTFCSSTNITLNKNFDSGSYQSATCLDTNIWEVEFKQDSSGCTGYDQCTSWFMFQMQNATAGTSVTLTFPNLYDDYGGYWNGASSKPYVSCNLADDSNWTRTGTRTASTVNATHTRLNLTMTLPCDNPYIAAWLPYQVSREQSLISAINTTGNQSFVDITLLGSSDDGRPVYEVKITNEAVNDSYKYAVYVPSGLHASETYGDYIAEGMIKGLLDSSNPYYDELLNDYVFYFYPATNLDGRYEGFSRRDPDNVDLNRAWDNGDTSSEIVNLIKARLLVINATGLNNTLFLDLHGNGGTTSVSFLIQDGFDSNLLSNFSYYSTVDNSQSAGGSETAQAFGELRMLTPQSATLEYVQYPTTSINALLTDAEGILSAIYGYYGAYPEEPPTPPGPPLLNYTFTAYETITGDELSGVTFAVDFPRGFTNTGEQPYAIIEGTLTSEANMEQNGCLLYSLSSSVHMVTCNGTTTEIKRAKLYQTLFYDDGSTIVDSFSSITSVQTSVDRDIGKRAFSAYIQPQSISTGSHSATLTGTFENTTTNYNLSIWPELYCASTGTQNYHGTDLSAYEKANPSTFQIDARSDSSGGYARLEIPSGSTILTYGNSCNPNAYVKATILTVGDISFTPGGDVAAQNNVDYLDDYGIPPLIEAEYSLYDFINESVNVTASKSGYHNKVQAVDFSGSETDFNITGLYNTVLTVRLNNAFSGQIVQEFSGWAYSSELGYNETFNTTTGSAALYLLQGDWQVYIESEDYSISDANYENISIPGLTYSLNFSLLSSNELYVSIYDESTNQPILENVTVTITGETTERTNYTSSGAILISALTDDSYVLTFSSENYSARAYVVTVSDNSFQYLSVYLLNESENVIFTVTDFDSGVVLQNTELSMYRFINNSWQVVESHMTDISGKAQFQYSSGVKYRFNAVRTGYQTNIFYLDPVLFASYNIRLNRETGIDDAQDYQGASIYYYPRNFRDDSSNSFTWTIQSPIGSIESYSVNITYPGGSDSYSGNNTIGEEFSWNFTITGADWDDKVNVSYCYDLSIGSQKCFSFSYSILGAYGENSFMANKDNTYGLGLLERVIISTLIVLVVAGFASFLAGPLIGGAIGLFIFGFMAYMGFVPLWAILPSLLVGFILIAGRSSE